MSGISWIKITTDIFDDEKILLIESLPEHDSIIVIWFKLLAFAGKSNNNGVFMLNNKIPYTEEMLSTILRRPLNTIKLALDTFESFGMIERVSDVITIPNWEKHQNTETLDKIREQTRLRVQKYRAKQIEEVQISSSDNECNEICNATVTLRNDREREEEEEREEDIERENLNTLASEKSSNPRDNYSKIVFELWRNNGLPGSKDIISFQNKEFRLALQFINGIHSDDVIQACKNYISVLKLNGFYNWKYTFDKFATKIQNFLPDYFVIENYKDKGKSGTKPAIKSDSEGKDDYKKYFK